MALHLFAESSLTIIIIIIWSDRAICLEIAGRWYGNRLSYGICLCRYTRLYYTLTCQSSYLRFCTNTSRVKLIAAAKIAHFHQSLSTVAIQRSEQCRHLTPCTLFSQLSGFVFPPVSRGDRLVCILEWTKLVCTPALGLYLWGTEDVHVERWVT